MYVFTLTILTDELYIVDHFTITPRPSFYDERIVAVTPWLYSYMYYTDCFSCRYEKLYGFGYNVNTYPIGDSAL